ncbi:MAG: ABC transporter permease, partial [Armatimonadetes bacterium]|nr:ABC transporter permease [Armatimonadota bacterium]
GNPVLVRIGLSPMDARVVQQMQREAGFDRPLAAQFLGYMGHLVRGDLGTSWQTGRPVIADLRSHLAATSELALAALMLMLTVSLPLGVYTAMRRNTAADYLLRVAGLVGVSMPLFWFGLLLLYVFYYHLAWAAPPLARVATGVITAEGPTGLYLIDTLLAGNFPGFRSALQHLALPAITLAFAALPLVFRMTRGSVIEVLHQDYVRTAHAKGVSLLAILRRHVLRNAMIPVLTVIGLSVGNMLGGTLLVETVFSWPGMGRYVINAILARDYTAVQGFVLTAALIFSLVNFLVDVGYGFLDPRIRFE